MTGRRNTVGSVVSVPGVGSVLRLIRSEYGSVTVQVCRNWRCYESRVEPHLLLDALYNIAGDVISDSPLKLAERLIDALWLNVLTLRATFNNIPDGDPQKEYAAAKFIRYYEVWRMMRDVYKLLSDIKPDDVCAPGVSCIEKAREIEQEIDDELKPYDIRLMLQSRVKR